MIANSTPTRPARFSEQGTPPAEAGGPGHAVVLIACLLLALGCDRSTPPASTIAPTVPPGPGIVTGTVHFAGTAPTPTPSEGECCPGVPRPADDSVVVNDNGTLRNVVVYIKDGPNIAGPPAAQAVLAQVGCQYKPHVLALRVGQQLVVTSHDPIPHNIHIVPSNPANGSQNFGEFKGDSRPVTFTAADDDVAFKCDVHAWMRAHAMVFDHPCYAVTGDDGSFRIEHLPAGTYTLVAHHEQFGDLEQKFTVSAEHPTADVSVDYHK